MWSIRDVRFLNFFIGPFTFDCLLSLIQQNSQLGAATSSLGRLRSYAWSAGGRDSSLKRGVMRTKPLVDCFTMSPKIAEAKFGYAKSKRNLGSELKQSSEGAANRWGQKRKIRRRGEIVKRNILSDFTALTTIFC